MLCMGLGVLLGMVEIAPAQISSGFGDARLRLLWWLRGQLVDVALPQGVQYSVAPSCRLGGLGLCCRLLEGAFLRATTAAGVAKHSAVVPQNHG